MITYGGRRINCAIEGDTACKIQLPYTQTAVTYLYNSVEYTVPGHSFQSCRAYINTNMHGTSTQLTKCVVIVHYYTDYFHQYYFYRRFY
jgi:hypothetical protein